MLELCNYQKLTDCFKDWGYTLPYTLETLVQDLKATEDMLESERQNLATDNAAPAVVAITEQVPTRAVFERALCIIASHNGSQIPTNTLSAEAFAGLCMEYIDNFFTETQSK